MKQASLLSSSLLNELEKGTIRCCSCKTEKPAEEFSSNKSRPNNKNSYCRECWSLKTKKYTLSPKAKANRKARKRAYDATEKGKAAKKARLKAWKENHPSWNEYQRKQMLKQRFNLTPSEYDALLTHQGGVCAICKQPESRKKKDGSFYSLAVDHDHTTREVRGLLCRRCNTSLAYLEDPKFFNPALAYLKKFASAPTEIK